MPYTEIPDDLIYAYRSAYYRAGLGHEAITLHVDQYSEPLARLLAASGHRCAAFITACNPFGAAESHEVNMKACLDLRKSLDRYVAKQSQIIEGEGIDPAGAWSAEKKLSRARTESGDNEGAWKGIRAKCGYLDGGGSNSKARSASLIGLCQQVDQHRQLLMTKCSGAIMILFYEASPEANKE